MVFLQFSGFTRISDSSFLCQCKLTSPSTLPAREMSYVVLVFFLLVHPALCPCKIPASIHLRDSPYIFSPFPSLPHQSLPLWMFRSLLAGGFQGNLVRVGLVPMNSSDSFILIRDGTNSSIDDSSVDPITGQSIWHATTMIRLWSSC